MREALHRKVSKGIRGNNYTYIANVCFANSSLSSPNNRAIANAETYYHYHWRARRTHAELIIF